MPEPMYMILGILTTTPFCSEDIGNVIFMRRSGVAYAYEIKRGYCIRSLKRTNLRLGLVAYVRYDTTDYMNVRPKADE